MWEIKIIYRNCTEKSAYVENLPWPRLGTDMAPIIQNKFPRLVWAKSGGRINAIRSIGFLTFQTRLKTGAAFNFKLAHVQIAKSWPRPVMEHTA